MFTWLYYLIYFAVIIPVILRVGHVLHKAGAVYCRTMLDYDPQLATGVNNLLLLGYYLLNIGYAVFTLTFQMRALDTFPALVEFLSYKIGFIVLLLAVMHYINMLVIYLMHVYHENHFNHHKKLLNHEHR